MTPSRRIGLLAAVALLAALLAVPSVGAGTATDTWVRVQFADTIDAPDRAALAATGVSAWQYVPHDAYLVWATPAQAAAAAAIDGVADVSALSAADKIDAGLLQRVGTVRTEVMVYGPAADDFEESLGAVAAVVRRYRLQADGLLVGFAADMPPAAFATVASHPAVLYISPGPVELIPEDEGTAQILANQRDGIQPQPGYQEFLADLGLDGSGVTVAIVDDGIDARHPDFEDRVVARIDYSRAPLTPAYYSDGHGTHVAGITAGAPADLPGVGVVRDSSGLAYGQGVAPGASLVDQNAIALTRSSFPPEGGFEAITSAASELGAVGWNASWTSGEGAGAGYVASARMMDVLTRDADFDTPGNQEFSLVFSAGNSGTNGLTAPKEAKNVISTAASMSHRNNGHPDLIAGFSSRGPAVDGRILPVVTAPGQNVASARALQSTAICGIPIQDGFGLYALCSGTSMAAPHVTGAVALITQWWREATGTDPSPAVIKALLTGTATDMRQPDVPNVHEGWGRVNLESLFDPDAERVYIDQSVVLEGLSDTFTLDVVAADPSRPLRVMLVWTDAPAMAGAAPVIVNDLDLTVTADGATYLGNVLDRGASVTGGSPDRLHNTEAVFLPQPGEATYQITISAANLPADAIFGADGIGAQDFALVVDNAVAVN